MSDKLPSDNKNQNESEGLESNFEFECSNPPKAEDLGESFHKLTPRQQVFVLNYLKHLDPVRAFKAAKLRAKGSGSVVTAIQSLMRNPIISMIVTNHRAKLMEEMSMEGKKTLEHFKYVYLEAMRNKDYPSAISALDKIAKHFGLYKEHNNQKRYSVEEIEKIRSELESVGFDFRRKSLEFPISEN
jgi:hypothetical protein